MKPKAIYLLAPAALPLVYAEPERPVLARLCEFIAPPLTPEKWQECDAPLHEVDAIFSGWGVPRMDTAFLERFPALRVVFHAAGTVKGFVTDELWTRGVRVTCAAEINAIPVADFALSQILFCLKHGWQRVREVHDEGRFRREDDCTPGVFGSTVGLLSLSKTGRLVAERLRPFDVRVIAYDPFATRATAKALRVELCSLDDVFARADVVSCRTPLLPETTRMLRGRHFARMKRGASFINTARGAIVAEDEFVSVLRQRPDLLAVLDVTDPEPAPHGSPLFSLPNVVLTPHIAGSLGPECRRLGRMMFDEARRYLSGEPLRGEVRRENLALVA